MKRIGCSVLGIAMTLCLAIGAGVTAQSPYGLAARQTIPYVISEVNDNGQGWSTEINVHNPGTLSITTNVTFFGALGSATTGQVSCQPLFVPGGGTGQARLSVLCPLNPGISYGRIELSALKPSTAVFDDPAGDLFLANARVAHPPTEFFNVEGFPQGNLSGNKAYAAVTGLKNGLVNGNQWASVCFAAALNEPTSVFLNLIDGTGAAVGQPAAQVSLNPPASEIQVWNAFAAVNAQGNYDNVTALFSTDPQGGQGGAGVFAYCRLINQTTNQVTFSVAKYLDNNDEARQYLTKVSQNPYGKQFWVHAKTREGNSSPNNFTNLHVAYFQHPDRVRCEVIFDANPPVPYFDLGQMRLIDPDGNIVAGGPHRTFFEIDLPEKSKVHNGQNGRWLIEVSPDRTIKTGNVFLGFDDVRDYTLTCSSGNGHNQLEIGGHCNTTCTVDPNDKKYFLCDFSPPFKPSHCYQ
jgi:hypothetical protein